MTVISLSEKRRALLAELADVEAELREAACEQVASGRPLAVVAREAGVTRPTLYAWLRSSGADETRLAELDRRYERLVDVLVEVLKPAPQISRKGNVRSGLQAEHSTDTYTKRRGRRSPSQRLREQAEELLLDLGADALDADLVRKCGEQAGFGAESGDVLAVIAAELDEAYTLRKRLEASHDPFAD